MPKVYNTRRAARIRLARVERLREIEAPAWVIKWEQIHLALARKPGKRSKTRIVALLERHVFPRMVENWQ
jgi:hypothetical protein